MRKKNDVKKDLVSYKVEVELLKRFRLTSRLKGELMSEVVEEAIENYVNKHQAEIEGKLKEFFSVKAKPE